MIFFITKELNVFGKKIYLKKSDLNLLTKIKFKKKIMIKIDLNHYDFCIFLIKIMLSITNIYVFNKNKKKSI